MWLLLLEALAALAVLLFIVWWTMGSARGGADGPGAAGDERAEGDATRSEQGRRNDSS